MPRVKELRPQYMMNDIGSYIVGLMHKYKVKKCEMAEVLGVTPSGMTYKIDNNVFSYGDLILIFHRLGVSEEEILRAMVI